MLEPFLSYRCLNKSRNKKERIRKMALLLPHTFVFSCLPRGFWPLIRVLLITKALKEVASSPAHAKNEEAPGTHCLCMRLISPRCGDSGLFSDSSMSCDVRVQTRYSKLIRII